MGVFRQRARRHEQNDDEGPSESGPSLRGETLREDDVEAILGNVQRTPRIVFFLSLAFFAVSAVFFTVQRILSARESGDGRKERNARKALVLKLPMTKRPAGVCPDFNLSFVVPEDFKLEGVDMSKERALWQAMLYDVPDTCQIMEQILRSGARCLGKAHTEPVPYSLLDMGTEVFRNPEKEGTVTGGSYSGCAVLVRAGMADFAIAVDTVGDLRMTAACCGLLGFKPTHGSVLLNGMCIKSEALDTIGFLTEKPLYLSRIGEMMDLPGQRNWRGDVVKIFLAKDLFDIWMHNDGKDLVYAVAKAALSWAGDDQVEEIDLSDFLSNHATGWNEFDETNVYEALRKVALMIADYELKIKLVKHCRSVIDHPEQKNETERYHKALNVRHRIQEAFKQGIRDSKYVMLPALLQPPPYRDSEPHDLEQFTIGTQRLYALASLVGCPHLVFPLHNSNGNLYSVSIMAVNKTDKQLLAIGEKIIPLTYRMMKAQILSHSSQSQPIQDRSGLVEDETEGKRWREIGNACYKECNYEEAIVAYTEAIVLSPHMAANYTNRALAFLKATQFENAEEDCCKALLIEPNNAKALLRRGLARKEMSMYVDAQQDFLRVLALEENNRDARMELQKLERIISQL